MEKARLIYKVLSGQSDEAERAELERWIQSDPAHAEEFEDVKLLYEADLDFEAGVIVRGEYFYDGLRTIRERIEIWKRRQKRVALVKTIGIAGVISALVFVWSFQRIHPTTIGLSHSEPAGATSGILLTDNLTFENATLGSIFGVLRSQYDVKIDVISRELLSCRFTGTFYHGILVDEMLDTLARSEGFEFAFRQPRTFAMSGKGCPM